MKVSGGGESYSALAAGWPAPSAAAWCQHAQLTRQRETHVLLPHCPALDCRAIAVAQIGDALLDHLLGGAGPRGDQHRLVSCEPIGADLLAAVDQVSRLAAGGGQL